MLTAPEKIPTPPVRTNLESLVVSEFIRSLFVSKYCIIE